MRRATVPCVTRWGLVAARTIFAFSEQDNVLMNNQKGAGFKSNVWCSEEDMNELKRVPTKPKPDAHPTQIFLHKTIELFNASQVMPPLDIPEPAQHGSAKTHKPYGTKMALELDRRAKASGWTSKWWLSPAEVRKEHRTVPQGKSSMVPIRVPAKLYNAEQLEDPSALKLLPISGFLKNTFAPQQAAPILEHVRSKKFTTGLFYTANQAELYNLQLTAGTEGFELPMLERDGTNRFMIYNLEDLENHESIRAEMQRMEPDCHSLFLSGRPIDNQMTLEKISQRTSASKYWITGSELEAKKEKGWKLKPNVHGIPHSNFGPTLIFNADQFHDPAMAFRVAGTYTR